MRPPRIKKSTTTDSKELHEQHPSATILALHPACATCGRSFKPRCVCTWWNCWANTRTTQKQNVIQKKWLTTTLNPKKKRNTSQWTSVKRIKSNKDTQQTQMCQNQSEQSQQQTQQNQQRSLQINKKDGIVEQIGSQTERRKQTIQRHTAKKTMCQNQSEQSQKQMHQTLQRSYQINQRKILSCKTLCNTTALRHNEKYICKQPNGKRKQASQPYAKANKGHKLQILGMAIQSSQCIYTSISTRYLEFLDVPNVLPKEIRSMRPCKNRCLVKIKH